MEGLFFNTICFQIILTLFGVHYLVVKTLYFKALTFSMKIDTYIIIIFTFSKDYFTFSKLKHILSIYFYTFNMISITLSIKSDHKIV